VSYTGARRGESLGLRWCDLNGQTVRFAQQVKKSSKGIAIGGLKSQASYRTLTISSRLADALQALREDWPDAEASDLIFSEPGGGLPHPDLLSQWVKRSQVDVGVPNIGIHALRHTVVSLLIVEGGLDPVAVAAQVGHNSADITLQKYSHLWPAKLAQAGNALGEMIDGAKDADSAD